MEDGACEFWTLDSNIFSHQCTQLREPYARVFQTALLFLTSHSVLQVETDDSLLEMYTLYRMFH